MSLERYRFAAPLFIWLLLRTTVLAAESTKEPLPVFSGSELPEPPQQHAPWNPPDTALPAKLITSVRTLFDLGMADPRGCEYREFEAVVGSIWGGWSKFKTHGWILPHGRDEKQVYAVSWAGTIYPALSIGQKADLKMDIVTLLKADEPLRTETLTQTQFDGRWIPTSEQALASSSNMVGIKVAFLLRLGEGRMAEQFWDAWRWPSVFNQQKEDAIDPFRQLAFSWLWATFDRAVCAHMRGDDRLALADCRRLETAWPKSETEADQRKVPLYNYSDTARQHLKMPHFSFLEPLAKLSADTKRRVKAAPHRTVIETGIAQWPDKVARIHALVDNLEEVSAHHMGQPGGVSLNWDPIIKALLDDGSDAVEPLLNCLEHDERLTRSVSFGRDFFPDRHLIPVKTAAEYALSQILRVNFKTASEYRRYWQQYHGMSPSERWYRTLLDDNAGRQQWMQAAENILGRNDGETTYGWRYAPRPNATNHFTLAGLDLRSKKDPSVSDLLLKRALLIAPKSYRSSEDCWTFQDAADLCLMLAEWDKARVAEGLSQIIRRCPVLYAGREAWNSGCAVVVTRFAALAVALAEAGDTSGLDLYAKWVRGRTIKDLEDALPGGLSPLGRFPNHPSIKEASANLFLPGNGDWLSMRRMTNLMGSNLLLNESFRALVLLGLQDKSVAGDLVFRNVAEFDYTNRKEHGSGSRTIRPDAFAPRPGMHVSFRVCDHVAHRLTRIEGLPRLELYWPEAKRDEALAAVTAFLEKNGNTLKLKPASWPYHQD